MRLPKNLLTGTMTKPRLFLCETDKTKICELDTFGMNGSFKFNAYSELTFTVGRTYTNMITGKTQVNPFYDKIEALRLIYLEDFGYFEIQDPEITSDGIREVKEITAYSLEYTLSQKYLENLNVNTGEIDSVEVIYANGGLVAPVTFYNPDEPGLSLLHLALEKIYGWEIGHVDSSLTTMGRTFEISRASVYDFLVQDICEKFNCFVVFDTINNKINFYAEALITKHIGDGTTTSFLVSPPYKELGSVSVDGYRTTAYTYNSSTGRLIFDVPPDSGSKIEITDGAQEKWTTDVYVSFHNLAQNANVNYSADDIKTVLTVKGADDLDIREVNMGLPYIVDLSYYYSVDWMGQELFDAYTTYLQNCANKQDEYKLNAKNMLEIDGYINFEENRLSLEYSIADNVTVGTTGTYYVRGGTAPNYYYTEVKLPGAYKANTTYYMLDGSDLDEDKFSKLYEALKTYFASESQKDTSEISELKDSFQFVETYTLDKLVSDLTNANTLTNKDAAIQKFFDEIFDQLGRTPLKSLYYEPYKKIRATNEEAGWNDKSNENYWNYYPVTLVIGSLEKEIADRDVVIQLYNDQYMSLSRNNAMIAESTLIDNNFTSSQLIRLSSFLREDEYTDDNFVETEIDTIDTIMQTKQELLECGRIELSKLCEPKLEFSMDMANIYALPEFEPIIDQFQLGNLINVALRNDYIKRARLLAVDINFDDFSDFSCEFGELTNLRTPSSIHADLLASAMSAGKSVASNASYWNKGSDAATSLALLIQKGLLDATTTIKSIEGEQGVSIDAWGIHLQKIDPDTGAVDSKEGWIVNNQFLYSDDNFKTTKSVFGEYVVDGQTRWGLLCDAAMAAYLAGCTIEGGTINIGDGTFVVDQFGNVTMQSSNIDGYVEEDHIISAINLTPESATINANKISLNGKTIDLTSDNITIDSTNFSVTKDGKITATSGEIAGWTIKQNALTKVLTMDGTDYQMYLQSPNGEALVNAFAVRTKSTDSNAWDTQFAVNYKGRLTAKDASITGDITATSLTLGSEVKIPYSKLSGAPDLSIYIAKDGTVGTMPASGKTGFKVSSSGLLTASNAVIYGDIYASGGTIAGYGIGAGGSYGNALYKRVVGNSADYEVGLKASSGDTDLAFYVKKSTDDWGSSSNVFYINNSGKIYAQNADITGKINASSGSIGSWSVGDMGNYTNSIYTNYCAASTPSSNNPEYAVFMRGTGGPTTIAIGVKKRTSSSTSWNDSDNPFYVRKDGYMHAEYGTIGGFDIANNYLRSDITKSGTKYQTFMQAADGSNTTTALGVRTSSDSGSTWTYKFRVNYDGSAVMRDVNITGTSTIDSACIGNLNASKITAGTFSADRIPNLSADKITSGTISTDRLSSSVITTGNFSSKSLSTGNLTVSGGGKIGYWNVTTAGALNCGSGTSQVGLTSSGVSHGSGWTASWYDIIQAGNSASDERLKTNISTFGNCYDKIFDNLRPVTFQYNIDPERLRLGFIAQDVKENFETAGISNFGGVYIGEGEDNFYRLLKEDFIALNTWQIQKLKQRLAEVETRLDTLEGNDTK